MKLCGCDVAYVIGFIVDLLHFSKCTSRLIASTLVRVPNQYLARIAMFDVHQGIRSQAKFRLLRPE